MKRLLGFKEGQIRRKGRRAEIDTLKFLVVQLLQEL